MCLDSFSETLNVPWKHLDVEMRFPGLLFGLPKDFEYLSLSLLTSQRKGHGIFVVVLPINGKLGLQLDAPPGIGQPPMIKKILPGQIWSSDSVLDFFGMDCMKFGKFCWLFLLWKIDGNFIDTVNGQHSFLVGMVRSIIIAALSGAVDDFNKQDTAYSKEFQIETRWSFHHSFCWCIFNPFGGMFWKDFETFWKSCAWFFSSAISRNKTKKTTSKEIYDMIVGVGDVTDPDLIMAELKKGLAAETKLALDRPRRIPASWAKIHRLCRTNPRPNDGRFMWEIYRKSSGKSEETSDMPGWCNMIVVPDGWRSPQQFLSVVRDHRNCKSFQKSLSGETLNLKRVNCQLPLEKKPLHFSIFLH